MADALPHGVEAATVSEAAPLRRHIFRARQTAFAAAGVAFGPSLPDQPCRAAQHGPRAALWLGPDEFLLLAPPAEALSAAAAITEALSLHPHALVDVSHRQCGLTISGPQVETLLSSECPLDLDLSAFPVGMCTRTLFGKAEIVLWRRGETWFHIEVWRSFVPYVRELLAEAALDL